MELKRLAYAILLLAACIGLTGFLQDGGHSVYVSYQDVCGTLLWLGLPADAAYRLPICNGSFGWPVCSSLQLHLMQPELKELASHVTIVRDMHGIPHIYGEHDADVSFGLAYAHAEDDFLTLQAAILAARCSSDLTPKVTKAQLLFPSSGSAAISDSICRLMDFERQVRDNYEAQVSPEVRQVLRGYARGLNFFAAEHPSELLLQDASVLFPISETDVAIVTLAKMPALMGMDAVLSLIMEDDPYYVVSFGSEAIEEEDTSPTFDSLSPPLPAGSTAFAVRSSKMADKSTALLINPHNPWSGHLSLYEAHVQSDEGWHMYGATWPGCPVLQQGVTENVAWAHGLNYPDLIDVYLLETNPDAPTQYLFDGEWHEFRHAIAPVKEHLGGPVYRYNRQHLLWSHYGPVFQRDHGTYAVRWSGYGRVAQLEQWLRMAKADNVSEWQAAHDFGHIPLLHSILADAEDNILYKYNGLMPMRDERYLWRAFLDGSTSNTLWQEYVDPSSLPCLINPPSGHLFNANSSPFAVTSAMGSELSPEDFAFQHGIEEHMTNRALRLSELLGRDGQLSSEDLLAAKWDDRYAVESDVTVLLSQVVMKMRVLETESVIVGSNRTIMAAVEALEQWDGRVDVNNMEAAIAVLTASPFIRSGVTDPMDYAKKNFVMVIKRFIDTAASLQQSFGDVRVRWGDVQRHVTEAGNLALGGAPDVLASEPANNGAYHAVAGDSFVMLVRYVKAEEEEQEGNLDKRKVTASALHHHGSSRRRGSEHNGDQGGAFAAQTMRPIAFYQEDVLRSAKTQYHPGS